VADRPRCSIVVPVYNRASLTQQCLDALFATDSGTVGFEVIVVDDGSTDETPELLARYGDRIRTVRHVANQGFAMACNNGAATASGEYLVFLNNDTVPVAGWLEELVGYADDHPRAAVVGSKLLFPDDTIQHAGVVVCEDGNPRHIYVGLPADHPAVNRSRRFQIVTAACALVRKDLFEQAAGFETAFRNGLEDADLCLRLGAQGHEIHYCPRSVLYHLESVSKGRHDHTRDNARLFTRRWGGLLQTDEFRHYVQDGLVRIDYGQSYPLRLDVSPLIAVTAGRPTEELENLLHVRSRQVHGLMRETVRLTLELRERGHDPEVATSAERFAEPPASSPVDGERAADRVLEEERASLRRDKEMEDVIYELQKDVAPSPYMGYRKLVRAIREVVEEAVPPGARVLVVSKGDEELLELEDRKAEHFPQGEGGGYAGFYPPDSASAIAHLERLRASGADYLVFPTTSLWWLEHYAELRDHLHSHYPVPVQQDDVCRVYALQPLGASRSIEGATPEHGSHLSVQIRNLVNAVLPERATVMVATGGDDDLVRLHGRRGLHFPQGPDGGYAGLDTVDSAGAIEQLESGRARGADYLLFPATSFWWLEHYSEFREHLKSRYRLVARHDDLCQIYSLRGADAGAGVKLRRVEVNR
jgi:GT2 family glycosyltransferase